MQQLGLNAIRVYSVDNSAYIPPLMQLTGSDHRECMGLLENAGIYRHP